MCAVREAYRPEFDSNYNKTFKSARRRLRWGLSLAVVRFGRYSSVRTGSHLFDYLQKKATAVSSLVWERNVSGVRWSNRTCHSAQVYLRFFFFLLHVTLLHSLVVVVHVL